MVFLEIKSLLVIFISIPPKQSRSYTAYSSNPRNCQSAISFRNIADENFFFGIQLHIIYTRRSLWSNQVHCHARQAPIHRIRTSTCQPKSISVSSQGHSIKLIALENSTKAKWMTLDWRKRFGNREGLQISLRFQNVFSVLSEPCHSSLRFEYQLKHFGNASKNKQSRSGNKICEYCFHSSDPLESWWIQKIGSHENEAATIVLFGN